MALAVRGAVLWPPGHIPRVSIVCGILCARVCLLVCVGPPQHGIRGVCLSSIFDPPAQPLRLRLSAGSGPVRPLQSPSGDRRPADRTLGSPSLPHLAASWPRLGFCGPSPVGVSGRFACYVSLRQRRPRKTSWLNVFPQPRGRRRKGKQKTKLMFFPHGPGGGSSKLNVSPGRRGGKRSTLHFSPSATRNCKGEQVQS